MFSPECDMHERLHAEVLVCILCGLKFALQKVFTKLKLFVWQKDTRIKTPQDPLICFIDRVTNT